jgi:hypothetical protein
MKMIEHDVLVLLGASLALGSRLLVSARMSGLKCRLAFDMLRYKVAKGEGKITSHC